MKMTLWLVCGSLLSCGVVAQQATNTPPSAAPLPIETPAAAPALTNSAPAPVMDSATPSTPAPKPKAPPTTAKKSSTTRKKAPAKTVAKKPAFAPLKTTPLRPGPATVVASNVNVRGQATLKGEVIGRLAKGQQVMVLEEVTLKKSAPDEPSAWAKIQLPPGIRVWVHSMFIDADSKKVKPRRLNLRGGPGENYSVLGTLEQGQTVDDHQVKGDWLEIDAPPGAYAFVAAQYLSQEPGTALAGTTSAVPSTPPTTAVETTPPATTSEPVQPPTTNTVTEAATIATAPVEPPSVPPGGETAVTTPDTNTMATATAEAPTTPAEEEPLPPRIVQREGVVRGSVSIQAPTRFELFSPESRRIINYLYIDEKDLDLGRYKGLRIIVTGEEGLDERWRNTPVLNVQRIQVLE